MGRAGEGTHRHHRLRRDHRRRPARAGARRWSPAPPAPARRCSASSSWSAAPATSASPACCLAFEESEGDLATNVASLGFDLAQLERDGLLAIDAFRLDPAEIVETGAFDLEGLFIRLAGAVESVGAKRVVIDTIEVLFTALPNEAIVRGELGRLFRWLKERDLTAVITGERGDEGA